MENPARCTYLLLDFGAKLQPDVIKDKLFLKIINLNKKNPLVQINDFTFKGTYDSSLGTNIYLDEIENPPIGSNVFEQQTPIHLKPVIVQNKVLHLKQVKLTRKKIEEPVQDKPIQLNLKWNYKTLLEKFDNGTLDFELLNIKGEESQKEASTVKPDILEVTVETESTSNDGPDMPNESELQNIPSKTILEYKYERLKELARRPVKRCTSSELVEDCDPKYKDSFELHNLKCQIQHPCNAFFSNPIPIKHDTLSNAVDIDRCVLYGIIPPSDENPRILTNREKNCLLTLDNFDNLSYPARYYVLNLQVQNLEEYVKNASKEELNKVDEYGRTPVKTLEIYKELANCLKTHITVESKEVKPES